jgi:competence protein ComEA
MKKLSSCLLIMLSLLFVTSWVPVANAATTQAATAQEVTAMVNVNTASAKELQTLPGIGQVTAQRIIDYRTAKGPFATLEDLLKVKGLGQSTLQKISDRIVLQ